MIDGVTERLASLGYTLTTADTPMLNFINDKVVNEIKKECGVYDPDTSTILIPDDLQQIAVDMVVGEFLFNKKAVGQLTGFDISAAVKQIQEGDTNITYAIGSGDCTPEQRLDSLINYLMTYGKPKFASYRSIAW